MAVLQLKNDAGTEGGRCPSCGAVMPSGAIICVECGYDTRSGRKHEALAQPDSKRWVMLVGVAVGVIVLGLVARFLLSPKPAPVTSLPPPVAEPATPAPVPVAAPVAAVVETVAVAAAESLPVDVAIEAEPPPPDPDAIAAEQRPRMEAELDRVAPLFEEGQEADLRLARGLVARGVVVSRSETNVVLVDEDAGTNAVDFVAIDPRSRVRVDPAFRAQFIDARLKQVVERIVSGSTNGAAVSP